MAKKLLTLFRQSSPIVLYSPAPSLSAELLTDPGIEAWTSATNATSYSESISGTSTVNQETSLVHGGSNACRLDINASNSSAACNQTITGSTAGDVWEMSAWERSNIAGKSARIDGGNVVGVARPLTTSYVQYRQLSQIVFNNGTFSLTRNTANSSSLYFDDVSCKKITLDAERVAASANMRITQLYTLPASPIAGDALWLMPRISAFTSGNYWLALLDYDGTQWNVNLYSVSSFTRTSRTSATGIGSTVGLRVNMNGSSITLETTADGSTWTQRGTTVNNSTYLTSTGFNVLWSSNFTVDTNSLKYEPAA